MSFCSQFLQFRVNAPTALLVQCRGYPRTQVGFEQHKLKKLTYGNGDYEEYVYDSLERLVEVKFNGATEYIVKYDNNGRLYSLTENGATHIYEYDSLDRLVRAWQEDTNGNYIVAVENSYDDLGRAKGSTYVVGDREMSYVINYKANSNLVNYISMPVAEMQSNISYTYDEFERVTRKQNSFFSATNFYEEYGYYNYTDAEGAQHTTSLVSTVTFGGNATNAPSVVYSYTYNNLGNITQIRKDGVIINEYTYDSLGQLVCEEDAVAGVTYIYYYDKAGNITQKDSYPFADGAIMGDYISYLASQKQTVATYTYGNTSWGDLLTAYDGAAITYDAIGNPTKWRDISTMTWEGRELQSATVTAGPRVTYEYNSSGIRTKKTLGSAIEYKYTLDGTKILSETATQLLSGSSYTLYYLYDASGSVQGFIYNNQYYYFQKNLQGDVVRILNSSGAVVTEYTYDAWGNVLTTTGSLASTVGRYNPFRYRSYYYDEETGFYYLQSRYYDPTVGRFLNADGIIGANGGIEGYNMFAYCNNNPIIFADYNGFLRSYSVIVNDGGSSSRNNSEEKSEDEYTKTYTFYRKTKSIDIGSHTVEFEYTYQVDDTKIISAKIESYKLTETPSLFYSQIVDGDVRIVDDFGRRENGSLEFTFIIEDTLFIALPFKYLDMFSIDVHTHPFTFSTYISHDWSSEDDSQ